MKGMMNRGRNSMIHCGIILAVLLVASCSNKKNRKLQEIKKVEEQAKAKQNNQTPNNTTKTKTPTTTVGVSQEEKLKAIELELEKVKIQNESLLNQLHTLNDDKGSETSDISPELCTLYLFTAHQMLRDSIIPRTMLEKLLNDVVAELKGISAGNDKKNIDGIYEFTFQLDIAIPLAAGTNVAVEDQEVLVKVNPSKHSINIELQSGVIISWELTFPISPDQNTAVSNSIHLNLAFLTKRISQGKLTVQLTDRQRAELIFLSDIKKDLFGEEQSKLRLDDQFLLPTVYDTVANDKDQIQLGSSSIQTEESAVVPNYMEKEWIKHYVKDGKEDVRALMNLKELSKFDAFRLNYIAQLAMPSQCQDLKLAGIELPATTTDTDGTQVNLFAQEAQTLQEMANAAQKDSFFEVFQSFLKNPSH